MSFVKCTRAVRRSHVKRMTVCSELPEKMADLRHIHATYLLYMTITPIPRNWLLVNSVLPVSICRAELAYSMCCQQI